MGPFYYYRKVLRLYNFPFQIDSQEQYLGTILGSGNAEFSNNLTSFEGIPKFHCEANVNCIWIGDFGFCRTCSGVRAPKYDASLLKLQVNGCIVAN